ncbi:type 1 glutamine amidotransferase [Nocardioides pocheonensis]|uniref:type 1 glutamine amidotransferase n=1 Tax=Nocardioides pocheonensis TaxID=661485 RepID=UPI001C8285B6|nr:glutamine amidotransferase [Nocardioides pocheonensis]
MRPERVGIVVVYPRLLGLYGDRGNGIAVQHRAEARGIPTSLVEVEPGDPIPEQGDLYLVGGGEDRSMTAAARLLDAQAGLRRAVEAGAGCLAVCAGLQLLAREYVGHDGSVRPGLGLLDVTCGRLPGPRAVGEVVARSEIDGSALLGFENHQGDAVLGPLARPLGVVAVGRGNGHDRLEGARQGRVIGTYLHGPVLVRNPALADWLLAQAVGHDLAPLADARVERLRRERLRAAPTLRARRLRRG